MARKLSRRTLADYAAKQLSEGASQQTIARQLAAYLLENRRTSELSILLRDIAGALVEHGHVTGSVTVAHELGDTTLKEIEAYTKAATGASQVTLDVHTDAALIGGMKLELPGHELDTTIARQLTLLKTRYKKA